MAGDFNGDGIPDLAITTLDGSNRLYVLLGDGSGGIHRGLRQPLADTVGSAPIAITASRRF